MELPAEWSRYRRLKVELGQFGLADDFSFEEHNSTPHLCTLDATAAGDGYVNPLLLLLYLLPWTQSFCLGSLSASQFALSDELGFLFHMMRASAGSCCQPRNFHRALKQSREASALHLVDVVDVEGSLLSKAPLWSTICKFVPFLLEQLRREAREAKLAAARSREEADARRAKQREMEMLTGAVGGAE